MRARWLAMLAAGLFTLATPAYAFIPLSGAITTDTTLVAGEVYHLTGSVDVVPGVTLTIPAGTVLKAQSDTVLSVTGTLLVNGTATDPVHFTDVRDDSVGGDSNGDGNATSPAPNWWLGISVDNGGSATLDHARIRYGGRSGYANLRKIGPTGTLIVRNSLLQHSVLYGLYIGSTNSLQTVEDTTAENNSIGIQVDNASGPLGFTRNTLRNNAQSGVVINGAAALTLTQHSITANGQHGIVLNTVSGPLDLSANTVTGNGAYGLVINGSSITAGIADNSFANNTSGGVLLNPNASGSVIPLTNAFAGAVHLTGGQMTVANAWNALRTYHLNGGINVGVSLAIPAGTVLKAQSDTVLSVTGTLLVNGTATDPVHFTDVRDDSVGGDSNGDGNATSPAPNWWLGISVDNGGSATLDHARIRYGGRSGYANLRKIGPTGTLIVRNSLLQHSVLYGLYIGSTNSLQTVEDTTAENNSIGIQVDNASGPLAFTRNTLRNNAQSGVVINGAAALTLTQHSITANGQHGIVLNTVSGPLDLSANTVTGNGAYGLVINGSSITAGIADNSFANNTSGGVLLNPNASGSVIPLTNAFAGAVHLTGGQMTVANAWNALRTYHLNGGINVGVSLAIPAGTVLKAQSDTVLSVTGTLLVNGTATDPVHFTDVRDDSVGGDSNGDGNATSPAPNWWLGISVDNGGSATLDHARIRYGGRSGYANLRKIGPTGTLIVRNSLLQHSVLYGLYIGSTNSLQTVEDTTAENNSIGIQVDNASGPLAFTRNTLRNNAQSGVVINGAAALTLTQHSITANGQHGIVLNTVSGPLDLSANTVTGNGAYGLVINGSSITAGIADNSFANNTSGGVLLNPNASGSVIPLTNAFAGAVHLTGGQMTVANAWNALRTYHLNGGINVGVSLAIPAGTVLKAQSDTVLSVTGTLLVNGTATDPVHFTDVRDDSVGGDSNGDGNATSPAPNWWLGISVDNGGSATLDHARIRYGGRSGYANLRKIGPTGTLIVRNSLLQHSVLYGLYIGSTNSLQTVEDTTAENNSIGIQVDNASGPLAFTRNTLRNNAQSGVVINGAAALTLTQHSITANGQHGIVLNTVSGPLDLSANTVTGNGAYGLVINGSSITAGIADNSFANNTSGGVLLNPNASSSIIPLSNTFAGAVHLTGGQMTVANAWNALRTYHLNGGINVGVSLAIPAGTVLKAQSDTVLSVTGTLLVNGTAADPVHFTDVRDDSVGGDSNGDGNATSPAPNWWLGISVDNGGSATLDHARIRYGGRSGYANLRKIGPTGTLIVRNSLLQHSVLYGLYIGGTNSLQTVEDTTAENNSIGIQVDNASGALGFTRNTLRNNAQSGVVINGAAALTLTQHSITGNGQHGIVLNTVSGPVDLSGNTVTGNTFYGLNIAARSIASGIADNDFAGNTGGGVLLDPNASSSIIPLSNAFAGAVHLSGGDMTLASTWNALRPYHLNGGINVGVSLAIPAGTVLKAQSDTVLSVTGTLLVNGTAADPVHFTDVRDDSVGGDSNGDGNATSPAPNWWLGISVDNGGSATLDHARIRYGGRSGYANLRKIGPTGTLIVRNSLLQHSVLYGLYIGSTNSLQTVEDTTAENNSIGIQVDNASGPLAFTRNTLRNNAQSGLLINGAIPGLLITLSTFTGNLIGIDIAGGANPLIGGSLATGNDIFGNTLFGVRNQSAAITVLARSNWWGHRSGPLHPTTNPDGQGNAVSDWVDYEGETGASVVNPVPAMVLDPETVSFGPSPVGQSTAPTQLTIENLGTAALEIGTIVLAGSQPGDFVIANNTASGATLEIGATATLDVSFVPTAPGTRSAILRIPSNDPLADPLDLPLTGFGRNETTAALHSSANPTRLDEAVTFTASVTGQTDPPADAAVQISASTGETCTDDAADSVVGNTARYACAITFANRGPRTLTASYAGTPTHAGSASSPLEHAVMRFADLTVSASNGVGFVLPGQTLTWQIQLRNLGPDAAPGTSFVALVEPVIANASWTCTAVGAATCPAASGNGPISAQVALAADSGLDYAFSGTLPAVLPPVIIFQAEATPRASAPDYVHDPQTANNLAEDTDRAEMIFRNGFETPPTPPE